MAKNSEAVKKNSDYSAADIYVLEGLEPVRKRPGMYIGTTGADGLHHLVWEVVDNSIDEALAGYAKRIEIELLPDNRIAVRDDGRGIPVEKHKQTGKSALETVMTTLHAGGKFGGESYKVSGGLHGVGVSVVNALSAWLRAEVCRDGELWVQEYKRGKPQGSVKKSGKCQKTGTTVIFEPDPEIFLPAGGKMPEFSWQTILERMRRQAYLTKGLTIALCDHREEEKAKDGSPLSKNHAFYFEGGIVSYIKFLNAGETPKHKTIFYANKENIKTPGGLTISVEIAFQYIDDVRSQELSFANNIYTPEGGTHLTGFRAALTRSLNNYGKKSEFFKKDDDSLTGDDVREGLTAVISIKLSEAQFEGQTKAKLGTPEARSVVELVVGETVDEFLDKNPNEGREIMEKAALAAKARLAAKAARDTVLRKGALEGMMLPGKLADCTSKDASISELYIVEGDSAGGCFEGETKVALADGRSISFKELAEESAKGIKHYCYTIAENGNVQIGEIINPRLTKRNAEVIKIILDNNAEILCTPEHLFMLTDGTYREARKLTQMDSLMPLYRQYSKMGKRITIEGYEMVFDNVDKRWIFTHMLSDAYNLKKKRYAEETGSHRHHVDLNKLNNNPENIIRLDKEAHLALHKKLAKENFSRPEVLEKLRVLRQTNEFREIISKAMKAPKMRKLLSARAKRQWENPAYKDFMKRKFLEFYKSNLEYRNRTHAILASAQAKHWNKSANREQQAKRVRDYFVLHPERVAELSAFAKIQWRDEELRRWRSETTKLQWTKEFRLKRLETYNRTYRDKALKIFHEIFRNHGAFDFQEYEKIRKLKNDKSLLRYSTILNRYFDNDFGRLSQAIVNYNHRIKSIEHCSSRADVYDLEVPGTHNFALASGIFVHNSAKQGRDRMFQAILPLRGKILNVEKSRLDKMLQSKEIRALIIALGAAIGDEFDESKLRYHRVIIMTDADVDGAHIRTLLLTLFFRYFPRVIELGYLYIAEPPLYRVQSGKEFRYAFADAARDRIVEEFRRAKAERAKAKGKKEEPEAEPEISENQNEPAAEQTAEKAGGINIQRYKGLGEMNPDQLWETTMNPANRVMQRVMIEDAEAANRIFDILMGDEVAPRKKFIQTHAKAAKNLDI